MRINYLLFLILFIQLTVLTNVRGQNSQLNNLSEQLDKLTIERPQEKVFLHTARKFYVPGNPIWFQAYVTATAAHLPSFLSTNLRVELFSKDEELIVEHLIFADGGYGEGVIDLPRDLLGGSYLLRSYTNYMRNYDSDFFFEKEIIVVSDSVINNQKPNSAQQPKNIDLQFFPEGGHLVADLATRVAFKAIDQTGHSIDIEGTIYNQSGEPLDEIYSEHNGMGEFNLIPSLNESYYVKLEGYEQSFKLPEVQSEGYSLYAFPEKNQQIRLRLTTNMDLSKREKFYLMVHSRGELLYNLELNLSNAFAIAVLPTKDLPEGINHITLFDDEANPMMERLVFIKKDLEGFTAEINKAQYTTREKVELKIKALDSIGNPESGIFSLSVIDLGQSLDYDPEETIYSNLLLSSDLKGFIENPMYYFTENNENAETHLDLLMRTHGWARFSWEELKTEGIPPLNFYVEQGLTLSGTMYKDFSKKVISEGEVTLVINEANPPLISSTTTSNEGKFTFEEVILSDNENFILKGENARGRDNVRFELDSIKYDWPAFSRSIPLSGENAQSNLNLSFVEKNSRRELIDRAYDRDSSMIYLDDFVVEASRDESKNIRLTQTAYGNGTAAYNMADSPSSFSYDNVFSALVGKFTGVTISPVDIGGAPVIKIRDSPFPPLILIDDVPADMTTILSYAPDAFSRVVLFKGLAATNPFGSEGAGGVLAFYTKAADGIEYTPAPESIPNNIVNTTLPESYHASRKFYAPRYDVKKDSDAKYDQRLVLHWQPLIELDENGEATINFWNTDEETSILIDLQGLMFDGTPVSFSKTYEVRKN